MHFSRISGAAFVVIVATVFSVLSSVEALVDRKAAHHRQSPVPHIEPRDWHDLYAHRTLTTVPSAVATTPTSNVATGVSATESFHWPSAAIPTAVERRNTPDSTRPATSRATFTSPSRIWRIHHTLVVSDSPSPSPTPTPAVIIDARALSTTNLLAINPDFTPQSKHWHGPFTHPNGVSHALPTTAHEQEVSTATFAAAST